MDRTVLVLDRQQSIEDYDTGYIVCDICKLRYHLTHNENWIVIDFKTKLVGKEIIFE